MSYAPTPSAAEGGAVEVTTSYFWLAFLLALCKPRIAINGQQQVVSWGKTTIPLPPGRYQVEAWVAYLFYSQMGRSGVVVDVQPGTVTRIRWKAPWIAFIKGPIVVTEVAALQAGAGPAFAPSAPVAPQQFAQAAPAAPVAPGGWHPDPSGRHQERYYDGTRWTEHVNDAGQTSIDRLEG